MSENKLNLSDIYLSPTADQMASAYQDGIKSGESSRIHDLEGMFKWMPGSMNAWTGWESQGKGTMNYFLRLVKSEVDGKKWSIWSPEQVMTIKTNDGKRKRSAVALVMGLIHAYTGKNPYKHLGNQLSLDEYMAAFEFIERHFYFLDIPNKYYKSVIEGFRMFFYEFGIYGWLVDPWKNLRGVDMRGETKDRSLEYAFDDFREMTEETNQVGDIIAHPKSMKDRDMREGGRAKAAYRVVTQYDLLGGSAWANSMDGIYSYHRPMIHDDPNSPYGSLYNLRQRNQHLTTVKGSCHSIYYDFSKNRFYFSGVCPIDASTTTQTQSTINFQNPYEKKKAKTEKEKENAPLPF